MSQYIHDEREQVVPIIKQIVNYLKCLRLDANLSVANDNYKGETVNNLSKMAEIEPARSILSRIRCACQVILRNRFFHIHIRQEPLSQ